MLTSATVDSLGFMVTAVVPDADKLIAERRASGLDRFDEVIEGVYFMVPPSNSGRGRLQARLAAALLSHDLVVATEAGVGFPSDYVIPDVVVYKTDIDADTIYADPRDVRFVVEILSDSNTGPHWTAKLARLADWHLPVVIFDGDVITNESELDARIVALFDPH